MALDTHRTRSTLDAGGRTHSIHSLAALQRFHDVSRLPFSLKILLENLLRHEDGEVVTAKDIERLASWDPAAEPDHEIAFTPARVLMQDFTGVPAVVDLAAMRDAIVALGGDPDAINPLCPAELVIDHSVQVDAFGSPAAFGRNAELEFERNRERYAFLRWGQEAFRNFEVVPPATGIVHQVNIEYLARVVRTEADGAEPLAYPDTLLGTDSHTTMVNGLGVLGWGVGGIEAEAAMLGQPVSMLVPQVVGVRFLGSLPSGATATDLVLTVTQILRAHGVVGKFVEFFGPGLARLPVADRATIANMAPEYGATCGLFPIDDETLKYLELTGRPAERIALVEAYARAQGMFRDDDGDEPADEPVFSEVVEIDLANIRPSLAGPKHPHARVDLGQVGASFEAALREQRVEAPQNSVQDVARFVDEGGRPEAPVGTPTSTSVRIEHNGVEHHLDHGQLVIAAITSCTNTSNPSVMVGAGLLARKAVERGLASRPWVKTSLAPGSKVVTDYLRRAGLDTYLDRLGFNLVGYGCTTCIGNSGPLSPEISRGIQEGDLVVASVLSGNRNFEGRINQLVKANYLASPALVVAFALAGRIDIDLESEPLGNGADGSPVYLADIWPSADEIAEAVGSAVQASMFERSYEDVFRGPDEWSSIEVPSGSSYSWDQASTYVRKPPYFDAMTPDPAPVEPIRGARVLAHLGDYVTTDHISPAGAIRASSPAGKYLIEHGVDPSEFNSYGSRRGNHEVMMRGTFANPHIRNSLFPGARGGVTLHLPGGEEMSIFDAAMAYRRDGIPTVVVAGLAYGSGSSRDWAAKGPALLGVRAVLARSYERIHRSNLIGMGILPLQFLDRQTTHSLGIDGREAFDIPYTGSGDRNLTVTARRPDGTEFTFDVVVRVDTATEREYFRHGGILPYVLRGLA